MNNDKVIVVGAGVIGLTTALVLAKDVGCQVTILAQHLPGDKHPTYASPWAGANYLPFSKVGSREHVWERDTWYPLAELAAQHPEAGIHFQDARLFTRDDDIQDSVGSLLLSDLHSKDPWFKNLLPNFRVEDTISSDPPGTAYKTAFQSVKRTRLVHIGDAFKVHGVTGANVVVNCTGLGARTLRGVDDASMIPVRGQVALVARDSSYMLTATGPGDGELTYAMQRPGGGGTIVGGCYSPTSFVSMNQAAKPDAEFTQRMLSRWAQYDKAAIGVGMQDLVGHHVGFRPLRQGGVRLELERRDGYKVVHCYGHGGYGYQTSWGCAGEVKQLVLSELGTSSRPKVLSRL